MSRSVSGCFITMDAEKLSAAAVYFADLLPKSREFACIFVFLW